MHKTTLQFFLTLFLLGVSTLGLAEADIQKMADNGNAKAQFQLAEQYFHGRDGKPRNHKEAFGWYEKAAKGGYMPAQFTLGTLYDTGEGTERDLTKAFYWYKKVAEQGSGAAAYNLADMYENGQGTQQSTLDAYVWYSVAGLMGYKDANPYAKAVGQTLDAESLTKGDNMIIETVNTINTTMRERLAPLSK